MASPTYTRTDSLSQAIERADEITGSVITHVCGKAFCTTVTLTQKQAALIASCCPGDQTGDLNYGLHGHGWSYTSKNGKMTLHFA